MCGRTGEEEELDNDDMVDEQMRAMYETSESTDFYWSLALQQDFRLELEKLIILGTVETYSMVSGLILIPDYIIRNTDRGADNYVRNPWDVIIGS
jgi:phosphatidylinositol 4-kinase type 2